MKARIVSQIELPAFDSGSVGQCLLGGLNALMGGRRFQVVKNGSEEVQETRMAKVLQVMAIALAILMLPITLLVVWPLGLILVHCSAVHKEQYQKIQGLFVKAADEDSRVSDGDDEIIFEAPPTIDDTTGVPPSTSPILEEPEPVIIEPVEDDYVEELDLESLKRAAIGVKNRCPYTGMGLSETEGALEPNLLCHIRWLSLHQERLAVNKPLAFRDGGFVVVDSLDDEERARNFDLFVESLRATYGQRLANRVIRDYCQKGSLFASKKVVTIEAIKRTLVGVAARVTIHDLKDLFHQLRKFTRTKNRSDLQLGVARSLMPQAIRYVAATSNFEELTASQLKILVDAFRKVPVLGVRKDITEALFTAEELNSYRMPESGFDWFVNDIALLQACRRMELFDLKDKREAIISEYLAQDIAYRAADKGAIIPSRQEDGSVDFLICQDRHWAVDDGVFSTLWNSWNDKGRWHMTFRGTQTAGTQAAGAIQSMANNVNTRGIVYEAYHRQKEALQAMLKRAKGLVDLSIHGHSQGGVYGQRQTVTILEDLPHDTIKTVQLFCHHSPAAESSCNEQLKAALKRLPTVSVGITYVSFSDDPIERFGNLFLGHEVEGVKRVVHRFGLKKGLAQEPSYAQIHSAMGWFVPTEQYDEDRLEGERLKEFYTRSLLYDVASYAIVPLAWTGTLFSWLTAQRDHPTAFRR